MQNDYGRDHLAFIQTEGGDFVKDGKKIMLRGWALGSWMNFEHFMMGLPGTHSMILEAFESVYGKERTREWLEQLLVNMVSEEDIQYLKSIGINSIRIPFGYHYFMDDLNPGVFLESGFEKLDRVVKLCEKYELYVILDMHSVPGSQNTDWHSDNITGQPLFWKYRCFQDQVIWLWQELASRYADNPWIAGYDIINEPGYGLTEEQINGFYERICAAIRKKDPHHIFFLEGIDFGRDFSPLPITQKLEEIRINRAKQLLLSGKYQNQEIAGMVGFSDPFYFSRRFKQVCGMTPTEYRKRDR